MTLTFSCQHDQLVGVYSDRLKKRGLKHGSGQKRGVLGTGHTKKNGVLGTGHLIKRGVFTAAHTCTGHICECPPGGIHHRPTSMGATRKCMCVTRNLGTRRGNLVRYAKIRSDTPSCLSRRPYITSLIWTCGSFVGYIAPSIMAYNHQDRLLLQVTAMPI